MTWQDWQDVHPPASARAPASAERQHWVHALPHGRPRPPPGRVPGPQSPGPPDLPHRAPSACPGRCNSQSRSGSGERALRHRSSTMSDDGMNIDDGTLPHVATGTAHATNRAPSRRGRPQEGTRFPKCTGSVHSAFSSSRRADVALGNESAVTSEQVFDRVESTSETRAARCESSGPSSAHASLMHPPPHRSCRGLDRACDQRT